MLSKPTRWVAGEEYRDDKSPIVAARRMLASAGYLDRSSSGQAGSFCCYCINSGSKVTRRSSSLSPRLPSLQGDRFPLLWSAQVLQGCRILRTALLQTRLLGTAVVRRKILGPTPLLLQGSLLAAAGSLLGSNLLLASPCLLLAAAILPSHQILSSLVLSARLSLLLLQAGLHLHSVGSLLGLSDHRATVLGPAVLPHL